MVEQTPFDAAVVIPTVLRPSLRRAVESVFAQRFEGRIQILIGIDRADGGRAILDELRQNCPVNRVLTVLDLGYSTARRNGGLYSSSCGGALRTILSYAAHSRYLAYLDDDNWMGEDHIRTLREAAVKGDWAFSLRWFVEAQTGKPLCVDEWESVGPEAGEYREKFGGFVDPNSLMIDKLKCDAALRWWCHALPNEPTGMSADRNVFAYLNRHHKAVATGQATSYYVMHPQDVQHALRMQWIAQKTHAQRG